MKKCEISASAVNLYMLAVLVISLYLAFLHSIYLHTDLSTFINSKGYLKNDFVIYLYAVSGVGGFVIPVFQDLIPDWIFCPLLVLFLFVFTVITVSIVF